MAHELIRFTLADPHLELLKEQAEKSKEDSIHVYAKKLLINLLGGQDELLPPSVKERLEDDLNEIRDAIKGIDLCYEMCDRGLEEVRETFGRRLDAIEEEIELLKQELAKVEPEGASPGLAPELVTDAQLAELFGVNKSTVTRWRQGKLYPPSDRVFDEWEVVGTRWQAKKAKSLGQEVVSVVSETP